MQPENSMEFLMSSSCLRIAGVVLLAVLATGCETMPVSGPSTRVVPGERLYAFQQPGFPQSAQISVTRDESLFGSGCFYAVWIDNALAARLGPGETSTFMVRPGGHVVRVGTDPQGSFLCAIDPRLASERETMVNPGEHRAYRFSIDMNSRPSLQRLQ